MTVDFGFKRVKGFAAATISWKGPWNDRAIRSKFEQLAGWLKARRARTGVWVFSSDGERRFTVGIEVKGAVKGGPGVRVRRYPSATVASVSFDPEEVAPRVIYHGLNDWLRWRKRSKEIRSVGQYREVYPGNPWKDATAWSRTEVQVVVRK